MTKTVPDTITSWVISGFSLDQVYGLGVTDVPMKLRVFRPFFLSLNVPYSVVKGEAVGVQVLVHNYMNRDVVADVTLDNSANQFTFTEDENEVDNSMYYIVHPYLLNFYIKSKNKLNYLFCFCRA